MTDQDKQKKIEAAQPAPVAAGVTPAELTDSAIDEVWNGMAGGPDGWLKQFGYRQFARAVATHALARVAASMAGTIRPTDDELWDQTIGQRDHYHDMADRLAEAIAKHCGVDIGEHSNQNCPWHEALDALASLAPVAAEPVRQVPPIGYVEDYDLARFQSEGKQGDYLRLYARQNDRAKLPLYAAPQVPTAAEVRAAALEEAHLPGWERGIATVTMNSHQLREALDFINPDGDDDPEQRENDLTFGIVQHEDDNGVASTGLCCWNDDTDGVLPLDADPAAPSVEVKGEQGEMGGQA